MRKLIAGGLTGLVAAGAFWWWQNRPIPVTVVEIGRGTAAEIIYATGLVEPERWAEVTSLERARIVETCRCEGHEVERGTMLFMLDDQAARAHVDELEARLSFARRDLQRAADLQRRGIATEERVDMATSQVDELLAALRAARSRLADYEITAPMAGIVLRLDGEIGEVVTPGEPLAWVGQLRPLLVVASVNEEDIPRVALGQQALIKADAFPGRELEGTVAQITPMGDPELKTYRVRLALPDDTPLFVGMTVEVNIVARVVEGAVLAPAPALADGAVFVVDGEGRVRRRAVDTGILGAAMVEITAGLEPGMRVVSPLPDDLADGHRVRDRNRP